MEERFPKGGMRKLENNYKLVQQVIEHRNENR